MNELPATASVERGTSVALLRRKKVMQMKTSMARMILLLGSCSTLLAFAGCPGDETSPCGDQVCKKGWVCDSVHEVCVVPEQLEVCKGKADGDQCFIGGQSGFVCDKAVCLSSRCGDGILDRHQGEECDDGDGLNSNVAPDACRLSCLNPYCGDGVVDTDEECDDGNNIDTDGCRNDCTLSSCGNGILDPGEECDHGPANSDTQPNACRTSCRNPHCGDAVTDASEECDDGNQNNNDACLGNCVKNTCGDGFSNPAVEECDGNDLGSRSCEDLGFSGGTLACRMECTFDLTGCEGGCGNNLQEGTEQCDGDDLDGQTCNYMGFQSGVLGCQPDCTFDFASCVGGCGNGIREYQEQCDRNDLGGDYCVDHGFQGGTLACHADCKFNFAGCSGGCGNGVVEPGEECDDGNFIDLDGCTGCAITEFSVASGRWPRVAVFSDDSFFLSWLAGSGPVFALRGQRFTPSGMKYGNEIAIYSGAGLHALAGAPDGRTVVVYSYSTGAWGQLRDGVSGQRFDSSGAPDGAVFQISSTGDGERNRVDVSMASDGRFVVVWEFRIATMSYPTQIWARTYHADGTPISGEVRVDEVEQLTGMPRVGIADDGSFTVVWMGCPVDDGSSTGIYARRYDGSAIPVGSAFLVNTTTAGEQTAPVISMAPTGASIMVWQNNTTSTPVYGQRYSALGDKVGGEMVIANGHGSYLPSVSMTADESFIVVWSNGGTATGRRYSSAGVALGNDIAINHTTTSGVDPDVMIGLSSLFVATWIGSPGVVFAQRFDAVGNPLGIGP